MYILCASSLMELHALITSGLAVACNLINQSAPCDISQIINNLLKGNLNSTEADFAGLTNNRDYH